MVEPKILNIKYLKLVMGEKTLTLTKEKENNCKIFIYIFLYLIYGIIH